VRFLIDQQLPKRLAVWIRARGHDAHHLKEIGLLHAEDADIWREAEARGAIIVSKDEDFSVIVRVRPGGRR
jgi:predicted nuclease of predicted toxin-antitoxin system